VIAAFGQLKKMPFETGFSLKTLNDSQLVFLTLEGNKESFNCLVDRYWPMAMALSISRISNVPEAEDIAQEGFVQAYQHLGTLRDPSRFAGWLTRIIREKCVDHYRRSKKNRTVSLSVVDHEEVPAFASNPGLTASQIGMIRDKISKLPEKYQRVIVMRFMGGLSTREISRQLNKKYGTVSVWFHRAYNLLRQELTPLFVEVQENGM
jgi:RNA polymerase sigma-70 factor (ECF subfamily)